MARARFDREGALAYLAGNPNFEFKKAPSEYTTSYLKRQAAFYQKAEQQGFSPSRAAARGHAPVRHIPATPERRKPGKRFLPPRPEQYSVGEKGRAPSAKEVQRILARKPQKARGNQPAKGAVAGNTVTGNITGVFSVDEFSNYVAGDVATLSFRVFRSDLDALLATGISAVDLANMLIPNADWTVVYSINVVASS